ncbi:MAG: glycosyltransferase family 4 protein [bacterium]|nr:glycosyltransferase family 4 protein [bacterium]
MKLLIATGMYPPEIGGPATFTSTVAPEFILRGHEVRVITYGKKQKDSRGVIFISRELPRGLRHIVYFLKMLPLSFWADNILVLDPVSVGLPTLFASKILRKKYVVRIVGDYAWEQGVQRFEVKELLDDFLKKKYGFFVERLRGVQTRVARGAKHILVPSEYLKGVVEAWGVKPVSIVVVPNSVHVEHNISRDQARIDLGISGTLLVSAGRLVPWKGFSMLISLLPELSKNNDLKLVIIGDGPDRAKLEALTGRLNLSGRVIFTGVVSKRVLGQYLAAGDVFVLNTGYEGFSHQILEAMFAGIPVITTDSGGNKEMAHDGQNSLIVPYNNKKKWADSIHELLINKDLRERISKDAMKHKEVYTIDAMINGIEKTLNI